MGSVSERAEVAQPQVVEPGSTPCVESAAPCGLSSCGSALGAHAAAFLEHLRYERRSSPLTVEAYERDLGLLARFLATADTALDTGGERREPWDCTTQQVRQWLVFMLDGGYTARAMNRKVAALRTFHRWLVAQGFRQNNACEAIVSIKTAKRLPVYLDEREMDAVLAPSLFADDYEGVRDRTILQLFYLTGMRVTELAGLTDAQVDLSVGQIVVNGKRSKQRIVPITPLLDRILRSYYADRRRLLPEDDAPGRVFRLLTGRAIDRKDIYKIVHERLGAASGYAQKSPHVLRHTFATAMLNNGADLASIKELLGHTSLAATEIYTHTNFAELERIYRQAHPHGEG